MDYKAKWEALKAKLIIDASLFRGEMTRRKQHNSEQYYQGHHDYAADVLKWMMEQGVEERVLCEYWHENAKHCGTLVGRTDPPKCDGDKSKCSTVYDAREGI